MSAAASSRPARERPYPLTLDVRRLAMLRGIEALSGASLRVARERLNGSATIHPFIAWCNEHMSLAVLEYLEAHDQAPPEGRYTTYVPSDMLLTLDSSGALLEELSEAVRRRWAAAYENRSGAFRPDDV